MHWKEMHWNDEWPQPVKLTQDEEKAWKLYCDETAGSMSARDFWHELRPDMQKFYLDKVNEGQVTVERSFLMQINACLKLYGSSLHSRGKSTKFPGLLSNKLTKILRVDSQSKTE